MSVWIGVDPGGRSTGVIAMTLGASGEYLLLAHEVVTRDLDEDHIDGTRGVQVGPRYLAAVADAIARAHDTATRATGETPRLAVETVVPPNPHVRRRDGNSLTNPRDALAAAMVYGAVLTIWPAAIRVPPAGHGSRMLALYPTELVTAAERRHGLDRAAGQASTMRHARSAWDIALSGPGYARAARMMRQEPLL